MLGRGVVNNHDLAPRSTWKVENSVPQGSDITTYTVKSMVGDTQANVAFERVVKVAGSQPFDIETHGTMLYELQAELTALGDRAGGSSPQEGSNQSTTDLSFEYHLLKDSLAESLTGLDPHTLTVGGTL